MGIENICDTLISTYRKGVQSILKDRSYVLAAKIYIVTRAADALTTLGFVSRYGIELEGNETARIYMENLGVPLGLTAYVLPRLAAMLGLTYLGNKAFDKTKVYFEKKNFKRTLISNESHHLRPGNLILYIGSVGNVYAAVSNFLFIFNP